VNVATIDAIAAAGARPLHGERLPTTLAFSTDTRTLAPGETFVALRGENFDGHAFVRDAVAAGAAALVVDDPRVVPPDVPALVVAETTAAYLAFAGVARRTSRATFVAITGSAGKTTTKTFLAQLLGALQPGRVVATPANENNEIGVAKLLLGLPDDAAYVVVELGARHYGEIAPLARAVGADVAVLTNVGEAHLEIMGSRERLAETKWGIFCTGALPVLFAGDAVSRERAPSLGRRVTWFACDDEDGAAFVARGDVVVRLTRDAEGADELRVCANGATAREPATLAVPGEHNRRNAAAAAAAAFALGFERARIARALDALALPSGRYERMVLGGFEAIYDAYNASTSGMLATLASFAREPATRRIAVLASMAELGADAAAMHRSVGAAAARSGLHALLVGGDFAGELARGAREAGFAPERIVPFATNAMAVAWLRANARPGDLVLFKGSRRYKLEDVVAGLRGAHADA
jgi:UDP-N-acetylmuramoyl-tripeptide--D-alanyl-D-alanine ligase